MDFVAGDVVICIDSTARKGCPQPPFVQGQCYTVKDYDAAFQLLLIDEVGSWWCADRFQIAANNIKPILTDESTELLNHTVHGGPDPSQPYPPSPEEVEAARKREALIDYKRRMRDYLYGTHTASISSTGETS